MFIAFSFSNCSDKYFYLIQSANKLLTKIYTVVWFQVFLTNNLYTIISFKVTILPDIGMMVRVFINGPGDPGSIPGRVIPKTRKMVLDT